MRRGLSRESVARGALELLDVGGESALTMRGLGRHLGVDPMAVYRHVPDKDALLDLVAEQVLAEALAEVGTAAPTGWRRRVRHIVAAVLAAVDRHPAAAVRLATEPPVGPAAMALLAELLDALSGSGAPPADVVHAGQAVVALTFASTAPGRRPTEATAQRRLRQVRAAMQDPRVAPALAAAATHLDAVVPTMPAVELLLDGLQTRRLPPAQGEERG